MNVKETTKYDCIIVGAGAAGLTAAIYGMRAGVKLMVLEESFLNGGQITTAGYVDNYPGLPGIKGDELGTVLEQHAVKCGVKIQNECVEKIEKLEDGGFCLHGQRMQLETKTVLLALGARPARLEVPGEEELTGAGVSYCAVCDGAFYSDLDVAVIGGGNTALEEALFLAEICSKVYLIHRRDEFRGDQCLLDLVEKNDKIEILRGHIVEEILGEQETEGMRVRNRKNELEQIDVQGVFIAIGRQPNTELVSELVKLDPKGYIVAGEDGVTSVQGLYAAGDVRTKKLRQVITAASDGANAMFSVQGYLRRLEK